MGGARAKVVIRFPGSTEIGSLEQPPRRGQRIRSRSGDVWFVATVLRCGIDTYTVDCVGRGEFLTALRRRSASGLASDLLAASRRATHSPEDVSVDPEHGVARGLRRDEDWIEKYLGYAARQREAGTSEAGKSSARRPPKPDDDWIQVYLERNLDVSK